MEAAFLSQYITMLLALDQHNIEIHRNRDAWMRKPLLRNVYSEFYRQIVRRLSTGTKGLQVELGSGMGNIKEFLPDCRTTDLFPNPWLDQQENAYALSFSPESVADLILFDVWHHLEHPCAALNEFHRVLAPGGRVILFEPAISALGRLVYGLFHHEPLGMSQPIDWTTPADFSPDTPGYYAAQGNATRMFSWGEAKGRLDGWEIKEVTHLCSLSYFASGGFSKRQCYPDAWLPFLQKVDRFLSAWPSLFAARMIVVLEKR